MKGIFIILMTVLLSLSCFAKDRIEYSPSANSNFELRSNGTGSVLINGNYIENGVSYLKTNQYLDSAYINSVVGNTTTLYGWQAPSSNTNWTAAFGSKDLTLAGTLTAANDHLGNSKFDSFNGTTTYLSSTDAAFNFTGTFSFGVWVYRADWNAAVNNMILSRHNGSTQGWYLYYTSGVLKIAVNSDVLQTSVNVSTLAAGWHYIVGVRTDTGSNTGTTSLYIDGLLLGKSSVCTDITAAGNFEVGSFATISKFAGYIQDIVVHNATAWTPEQVKQLYARGSRRKATLNPDNTVDINLPLEGKWFSYTPVWYKSDGTTAFTPSDVNIARYMVRGDTVWYNENLYHTSSSGAAQLGNSTATLTSIYPIKPIIFDNTGIESLVVGASFTEYAEGNTSVMCQVALGSKLNHTFLTAFGASGTRAFTNATSGITTCSTSIYYRWQ